MRRLPSNWMNRAVVMILVAGMTVCCCHARILTAHAGESDDGTCGLADGVPPCCASLVQTEPAEDDREAPADSPKGCQICCIKGTGLEDHGPSVPDLEQIGTLTFLPAPVVDLPSAPIGMVSGARQPPPHFLEPRTLVRLHCALIV